MFVSVITGFLIIATFVVGRFVSEIREIGDQKAEAELRAAKLEETNIEIQKELMLSRLDEEQAQLVESNANKIEDIVPAGYRLNWRHLQFEGRLGSGSFGDCYRGTKGSLQVAIKRMRSGMVNKKGFTAFCKEVIMLASIDHINIVTFIGYSQDPFLLIVMEYVSNGTLADYVRAQEIIDPPAMDVVMGILLGSVNGLEYLHAAAPMPILHRDIKSENILLTDNFEPRIADLGEARAMVEGQAMTVVGTNGYTAPEVLRGEHYGTPADVYSFAVVMCEIFTLRAPYSDILEVGQKSWQQIVAMTHKEGVHLRPSRKYAEGEDLYLAIA